MWFYLIFNIRKRKLAPDTKSRLAAYTHSFFFSLCMRLAELSTHVHGDKFKVSSARAYGFAKKQEKEDSV